MPARHEVIRIESAKVATSLQSKTRPPSLVRDSSSASKIFVGGRDRKRLLFCTALKYGAKDGGVYPAKNTLLIAANFISVYSLLTASRIERHDPCKFLHFSAFWVSMYKLCQKLTRSTLFSSAPCGALVLAELR